MKYYLLLLSILLLSNITAQDKLKLGHINSRELIELMPEHRDATSKYESVAKEYQQLLEQLQTEYMQKFNELETKKATYTGLIREIKETELRDMNFRIQSFQYSAREQLEKKNIELYKPVIEKAKNAIAEVAKENSLVYVFDTENNTLIFHSENSMDILPLVKTKLNIN